jgi:S1-C subfamily serine protease
VNAPAELQRAIGLHAPGDTVTITAMRGGQAKTFKIKLIERPS